MKPSSGSAPEPALCYEHQVYEPCYVCAYDVRTAQESLHRIKAFLNDLCLGAFLESVERDATNVLAEYEIVADRFERLAARRAVPEDSARLDWLENAIVEGNVPEFVEGESVEHHRVTPSGFSFGSVGGTNLRKAIDAARRVPTAPPSEKPE